MDFALTPEQEMLKRTARQVLAETSPMTYVRSMMADARGNGDAEWHRLADLGWQGLVFPEDYGGSALSMVELALVLEEMGRVLLPGPFLSTLLGGLLLERDGNEAQRRRWLPGICDGRVIATHALFESGRVWDTNDVTVVARPVHDGFILSGTKHFVPDAHIADVLVLALRRANDGELMLLALERDSVGLEIIPLSSVDQTRKIFTVVLRDVHVAADRALQCPATDVLAQVFDHARVALAAEMCGGAERVLELTVEHAKVREQFGRPIGSFQAIQHKCADMLVAVETAKMATYYAAWALAEGAGDAALAAATAKAAAGDAYRNVVSTAVQVHGGIGFTWEHDLHIYFKRAESSEKSFGDAVWCRELVARHLRM